MQMLCRPAVSHVATTRSRPSLPSSLLPASVRPSVVRRFKEEDGRDSNRSVQDTKDRLEQGLKSGAQDLKNNLQQAAEPANARFDAQVKANPLVPTFTRRREIFVGRLAIAGIVAAFFWETILPDHPNILQQVSKGFGLVGLSLSPGVVLALIFGSIVYSGLIAIYPGNPTFSEENQQDVAKRPEGTVTPWGFSKKNELFQGRVAMLGFTAGIINQLFLGGLNGPGPLAQVAAYLRIPADDAYYSSMPAYFIGFTLLATGIAYLRGETGEKTRFGEKDIY